MVKVQPKSHSNELTVTIWWFLICNNVHNILRLCDAEQISSFYYNWKEAWLSVITGIYDLSSQLRAKLEQSTCKKVLKICLLSWLFY